MKMNIFAISLFWHHKFMLYFWTWPRIFKCWKWNHSERLLQP